MKQVSGKVSTHSMLSVGLRDAVEGESHRDSKRSAVDLQGVMNKEAFDVLFAK